MSFAELGLVPELLRAIAEEGYSVPTPIQEQAIPIVLAGRDIMAGAQTGTGKTAGFALPILQLLQPHANSSTSPARHSIRALILTPTRELAAQVEESFRTYGKHIALRSTVIYGGVNMDPQIAALRAGAEIVVATPGRLLDHVQQRTINLSQVQILVLDEADRMLDMGFIRDIRRIIELLPKQRQNLLFSATFSDDIKQLSDGLLKNPALIEVARRNAAAETVRQVVYVVEQDKKRALLAQLIKSQNLTQVLVFCRTKHGANRLGNLLSRDGINAAAIHSNKTQGVRERALADFKAGTVRVLVATDIAARGLDIEDLPHVVNFDIPHVPEDYIHRIGRTGRARAEGDAITLVAPEEIKLLKDIERLLKRPIERLTLSGFDSADHREAGGPAPKEEAAPRKQYREERRPARSPARPSPASGAVARPLADDVARTTHSRRPKTPLDPIFTEPYVATATANNDDRQRTPEPSKRKSSRPVAVLLGGRKQTTD
ncbi:MAG: DEAD/DEAH box helicase [Burkholderiales bacterium]|nr:DEAD/DEAH box helicase [Burkholderiales bacterium]